MPDHLLSPSLADVFSWSPSFVSVYSCCPRIPFFVDDISKSEIIEKTTPKNIAKKPTLIELIMTAIQSFCVWGKPFFQQINPNTNRVITKILT
jgi:hypothetical protein